MLNKILQNLQEKFRDNRLFQEGGFLAPSTEPKPKKLPIMKMLFMPLSLLFDYLKPFFVVSITASVIIGFFGLALGLSVRCSYGEGTFCSNSLLLLCLYFLIKIFVLSEACIKWHAFTAENKAISLSELFKLEKKDFKFFAQFVVIVLLNMLPLLGFWALYMRVPNPDWKIETVVFFFYFLILVMPFFIIRFYPILGCTINDQKGISLKEIWYKTRGNMSRILFSYFFILTISTYLLSGVLNETRNLVVGLYTEATTEIMYQWIFVIFALMVFNSLMLQYDYLIKEEKTENENN